MYKLRILQLEDEMTLIKNGDILPCSYHPTYLYYSTINHSLSPSYHSMSFRDMNGSVFTFTIGRKKKIDIVFPYFWYLLMEMQLCLQTPYSSGFCFALKGEGFFARKLLYLQDRNTIHVCVCRILICVLVRERERKRESECLCLYMCVRERERVCVCVLCVKSFIFSAFLIHAI